MKSTFFLDRDGVINTNRFVNTDADFQFMKGSIEAISTLTAHGHPLFIVTNQGGIEAGYLSESTLDEIHAHMLYDIEMEGGRIEKIYVCPHLKVACECRKPKPGMLHQAEAEFDINLSNAYFVGDYITDWQAALAAGVTPIAVRTGRYTEPNAKDFSEQNQIRTFDNLLDVAKVLGGSQPFSSHRVIS